MTKVCFVENALNFAVPKIGRAIDGMFHNIIAFADSFLHVIYSTADINLMQN